MVPRSCTRHLGVLENNRPAWRWTRRGEAQILYVDSTNGLGIRRYNSNGSAILFDTRLNIVRRYEGNNLMANGTAGATTVLGSTTSVNLPTLHPSQLCRFTLMPTGLENGYMARLGADGKLQQLTYMQGGGSPIFEDVAVSAASGTIALW